jgi:hypothetical protein
MILLERGIVPVEEVVVGDRAFTHRHRWRPVTATTRKTADTVRVQCAALTTGLATITEHAFYTRCEPVLLQDGQTRGVSAASWTRARDLTDRHRLASPIDFGVALPVPGLPASLAGMNLGEAFRTAGVMVRLKGAAAAAVCPELVDWLAEHFGTYGAGRRFPAWALTMPEELRRAFLAGLVNDGHHREQFAVRMHSKAFMVGLRLLVCSLGLAGGFSDQSKPGKPVWLLSWRREGGRRLDVDGHRWHRATSVERGPATEVFGLSVSEDGSCVADGITVQAGP